jgi:type III secretory pathway component EscV
MALARARVAPAPRAAALPRRGSARRRRRDIFLALLVAAGSTLVLGAIPGLRMLWLVHVAADVLLMGYVALLVRQRNLATERALKVRLLPTARRHEAPMEAEGRWRDGESGWLAAEPALLHRSAT